MDVELDLRSVVLPLAHLFLHWVIISKHGSAALLTVVLEGAAFCLLLFLGSLVRLPANVAIRPFRPRLWDFNLSGFLLFLRLTSVFLPPNTFWYVYLMILVGSSQWPRRLLAGFNRCLISFHTNLAALVTGTDNHQMEQSVAGQGPILEVQLDEDGDLVGDICFGHA